MSIRVVVMILGVIAVTLPAAAQVTVVGDTSFPHQEYRFFDSPVDADHYLIRPGEKLAVTFINTKLPTLALQVDAEGRIVHRNLGVVDLSDKTLTEARSLLSPPLSRLYNVDEIEITVGEPYRVSLPISGAVAAPGLYTGFTSQRVSELVAKAGGVLPTGSTRRVVLSGSTATAFVDLDRVRYLGDNSQNPCLYAGTRVHVPERSDQVVNVVGEIHRPREIELLPGDDLDLLLELAGGARSTADVSSAYVLDDPERDLRQNGAIKAGDVIVVPAKTDGDAASAVIFGAVAKPGSYGLREGLPLVELIDMAGGVTSSANRARVAIFRRPVVDSWGRLADFRFAIAGDLRDREYASTKLAPFDSVFVPVNLGYVSVSGQVRNPGFVAYVSGWDVRRYVDAAGGFSSEADRTDVVIQHLGGALSFGAPLDAVVYDGDEIVVRRLERQP